ncbi:hypothetical protein ACFLQV_03770 [Calditrichota bacterium]
MQYDAATYRIDGINKRVRVVLIIGVIALLGSVSGLASNSEQFFYSYLTAYVFWLSIALGALFFVMLHHMVGAVWSVVVRRIAEAMMANLFWLGILFIPLLFGMHDLFHWTHHDAVASDILLQKKAPYLNQNFFIIRAVIYFAVWFLLSRILFSKSMKEDASTDGTVPGGYLKVSAPGIILFAFTITFAGFDWLMSLDPHWYSTIYGVGFFSGSVMATLASMILITTYLRYKGVLTEIITTEHFHDIGKLMFAFVILWAYMAFSQYFLIWYANIPEETIWYHHRWVGSWRVISWLIVIGHFGVPFFALITRPAKRNPYYLSVIALWLVFMHWVDLYWNIVPNLHHEGFHISWMDLSLTIGMGLIFCGMFWMKLAKHPIVTFKDPKLQASIKFVNPF